MAVLVATVVMLAVMGSAVPALASCITIGHADGYLQWTGDYDWYSINLSRGARYRVTLSVPWSADFDVKIYYNSNGDDHLSDWELFDSGTNGTGQDEFVYFTANRSGKHYIKVHSYRGSGYYTLRIKRCY
jgi:hypothetical protein